MKLEGPKKKPCPPPKPDPYMYESTAEVLPATAVDLRREPRREPRPLLRRDPRPLLRRDLHRLRRDFHLLLRRYNRRSSHRVGFLAQQAKKRSGAPRRSRMAAKILANLIIMGSGILGRAVLQAYRKALENANKTGVAHEAVQTIRRASKAMTEEEARQILGISDNTSWEEVLKRYDNLFERNAKSGSFYLQSKVHRAKECLEAAYQDKNQTAG